MIILKIANTCIQKINLTLKHWNISIRSIKCQNIDYYFCTTGIDCNWINSRPIFNDNIDKHFVGHNWRNIWKRNIWKNPNFPDFHMLFTMTRNAATDPKLSCINNSACACRVWIWHVLALLGYHLLMGDVMLSGIWFDLPGTGQLHTSLARGRIQGIRNTAIYRLSTCLSHITWCPPPPPHTPPTSLVICSDMQRQTAVTICSYCCFFLHCSVQPILTWQGAIPLGTQRCWDVESTLIQRRNNVVCPVGWCKIPM